MKTLSDKIVRNAFVKVKNIKEWIVDLKNQINDAQKDSATLEIVDKDEVVKIINKKAGEQLI